jgi:hypothetical protein
MKTKGKLVSEKTYIEDGVNILEKTYYFDNWIEWPVFVERYRDTLWPIIQWTIADSFWKGCYPKYILILDDSPMFFDALFEYDWLRDKRGKIIPKRSVEYMQGVIWDIVLAARSTKNGNAIDVEDYGQGHIYDRA